MKKVKELGIKIVLCMKKYSYPLYMMSGGVFILGVILLLSNRSTEIINNGDAERVYALEDTLAENRMSSTTLAKEEETEKEEVSQPTVAPIVQTSMYDNIAIAHVTNYVNIRTEPNAEAEIVGKIYDGAAAEIIGTSLVDRDWYQVKSGNVEGFIKAEYFVTGEEASKLADELACKRAIVLTQTLFVRADPTTESKIVGMVPIESTYQVEQEEEEWVRVTIEDGTTGWLNKEYVSVEVEFDTAISIAEEQEALEAQRIRQELDAAKAIEDAKKAKEEAEQKAALEEEASDVDSPIEETITEEALEETVEEVVIPQTSDDLRSQIIAYAQQFLGNPYVWGGNSLVTGTDCSGFVMLIYQHFGYSLSRIPSGQYNGVGETISYSECQPGDIVIYGTSASNLSHSAIYIGDGKVIHEANRRMGVCISDANTFGTIYACKRIL